MGNIYTLKMMKQKHYRSSKTNTSARKDLLQEIDTKMKLQTC